MYDALIYVVGHKRDLAGVSQVDYYLGDFGGRIFSSRDRGKRFAIVASIYGQGVLCTARIHFENGTVDTWRYIDFEGGILGKSDM
jgi:hypothetical protein